MARNTSLSNKCNCKTKSAFDKNLNAKANSRKPKTTFTVFNHPPDFGKECNQPGNIANNINGNAKANENPNIPIIGAIPPLEAASTKSVPTIGPVQEKETIAKAKAMNKIPIIPPLSAWLSTLLAHELGNIISKAPKKEVAKTTNKRKKIILNQTLVDKAFKASAPKIQVTKTPNKT
ncbi:hypothetical protein D3C72_451440 [compost metagenome]